MSVSNLEFSPDLNLNVGSVQCQSMQAGSVALNGATLQAPAGASTTTLSIVAPTAGTFGASATLQMLNNDATQQNYSLFAPSSSGGGLTDASLQLFSYNNSTTPVENVMTVLPQTAGGGSSVIFPHNVSCNKLNFTQCSALANVANSGYVYQTNTVPLTSVAGTTGTCNGVMGAIAFTGNTILSGGTATFTIANSMATAYGHVTAEFQGASATSAPFINSIVWTAGTGIVIIVKNGGGFSTTAMSVRFTFSNLA